MRRYGRYCLATFFIVIGAWLSLPVFVAQTQAWIKHLQVADPHTVSPTANTSLVYSVKPKQWLTFAVPEESLQLRIITNANIQRPETIPLIPNWAYALHYELLDKNQGLLAKGLYHLHSNLTAYNDGQGGLTYANYYADKGLVPLDGRLILLGLQAMQGVAFLRVSLEAYDPAIIETAVRVYVPSKIAERLIATSWLRMSQEQKDNLAENSIYPASLLSAAEKKNLVKHQWQPLGPQGIEDKTYQSRTLYTLKDTGTDQDALMLASGLQADALHYGVIPIPEQGGQIALSLKALDGSALAAPVAVDLQWFGRNKEQRWQQSAIVPKNGNTLNYQLDGGLLLIRPASPVIVNAYLTTATEPKHDITDALLSVKTYIASFGVDFGVLHYQQHPAVMRIDVRRLLAAAQTPQHEAVRYQWLNAQQQVIASGELNALEQPSLFDRVGNITDINNVSEPLSYYFRLPEQVTRLRLLSDTPALLINAYNQPYNFIKSQLVPEDAYAAADQTNLHPSWFPLRALNDKTLMQQQAIQWINSQYRPPEDDPDVLAGRYLWQDYKPQGNVAGRYLLTGFTGDEPRTDALASVYCPLATNHDLQVRFNAVNGLRSVSPELIFLRGGANPFTAELFLNQQKVLALDAIGQQGVMQLPETGLGNHRLRLNTDSGGRWLMNYQAQCTGDKYLKRRVFALDANTPLDFVVQHAAEDEVFSARLYSPTDTVDRPQIKVDIEAIAAPAPRAALSTRWTYQKRSYDIRPLPTSAMPVLYTQGQTLSNGERFAIPINSDLPAGTYRIRITLAKGPTGYITLSQIKAGVHEQRRFYQESGIDAQ